MQYVLIVAIVLHVLAAVFWAGSTFTLTRFGGERAEHLFLPQMGAAAVVVITGIILWGLLHQGPFGPEEQLLAAGAFAALAAAGAQGALVGSARRRIAGGADAQTLRGRMLTGNRIAASLLAFTLIVMTVARFV